MKYLFFDIECCDGKHMCEFGYVLADERLRELERKCIIINPEAKMRLTGRKDHRDMTLHFTQEEYDQAPTFPHFYQQIASLLQQSDCQIVGFSLANDKGFLRNACKRYQLPPIDFTFVDVQKLYKSYSGASHVTSVEKIMQSLDLPLLKLHKSDEDALSVLMILQVLCKREKASTFDELMSKMQECIDVNRQRAQVRSQRYFCKKVIDGGKNARKKYLKEKLQQFSQLPVVANEFFIGKQVGVSYCLYENRYFEFVALIEQLYRNGATYQHQIYQCDLLIEYEELGQVDERKQRALEAISQGIPVKIISLKQALQLLGVTQLEQLGKKHRPKV